jgi:putative hemolysin
MSSTWISVLIVLGLILIEAVFVASEIALVSLREGQLRTLAEQGRRGAAVARLVANPNRFLATVQLGVTLTALLSSAFGAVTLSEDAKDALIKHGMGSGLAGIIGIVGVTLIITLVTLVIGELVPKRLGLQRSEQVAKIVSPTLHRIATASRPVIWLLSWATNVLVRALGGNPDAGRDAITEDELRGLVAAHESLSTDERRLIDEVFAAGERSVSEVMVPRTEVAFLEAHLTASRAARLIHETPHSRYPVVGDGSDDVIGFVHIRDLFTAASSSNRSATIGTLAREIKRLPGSKHVLPALSEMRREGHHLAIVVDEYGGTDGIVTLEDLIEEVIGDIRDEYDEGGQETHRLAGGVIELEGRTNLDEFASSTGVELPDGPYETASGFVMASLGRLPIEGDSVEYGRIRLTVAAVEGRRAARIRVTPLTDSADGDEAAESQPA